VFVKQVVPSGKLSPVHIEDDEVAEVQLYGEQQSLVILVYWEVYSQMSPPAAQSIDAVVVSAVADAVSELTVVVPSGLVAVEVSEFAIVVSELTVVVSELAVVVSELAVVVSELSVVVSELAVVVVVAWSLHKPSIQLRFVSQVPTLLAHDSPSASLLRYWQYQSTAPVGVVPEGM